MRLFPSVLESPKNRFCREGESHSLTEALQKSFGEPTTFPTIGFSESPYRGSRPWGSAANLETRGSSTGTAFSAAMVSPFDLQRHEMPPKQPEKGRQ